MLTAKDLALIRAALKYWRDEMSGTGLDAFRGYLDDDEDLDGLHLIDIPQLRSALKSMQIRYGHCDVQTARLSHTNLYRNFEVALQTTPDPNTVVATILFCPSTL
ncbi:MAG: hypothetical protein HUJ26_19475 [Planctomycetaceae bacterium]|uniref:hypothetical protein n=1 Tax=Thalassoglobus sp. TaxID=2795869 RepID=UPI00198F383F|nr:hypothetical protein [Planctomycetaceae bacterium]